MTDCRCLHMAGEWLSATTTWLDSSNELDIALLTINGEYQGRLPTSGVLWGRVAGSEPVSAAAIGSRGHKRAPTPRETPNMSSASYRPAPDDPAAHCSDSHC